MNINHLGEALLGEKEARRRLDTYIEDMKNPEIEYISVKISTIYSQITAHCLRSYRKHFERKAFGTLQGRR